MQNVDVDVSSFNIILAFVITFITGCGAGTNSITPRVKEPTVTKNDEDKSVTRHNEIRNELYSDSNLIWSIDVAESAQAYADTLAKSGKFEHDSSNLGTYGENLFTASYQVDYTDAINSWYGEKSYYNYADNSCKSGEVCGHYTQMIWKDSTELGCGIAQYATGSRTGWLVIVCRYNPPGNYVGEKPY